MTTTTPTVDWTEWRDRARHAAAEQHAFRANARAYSVRPIPAGDLWAADYRRSLCNLERAKADLAGQYAAQMDEIVGSILADRDHAAGAA